MAGNPNIEEARQKALLSPRIGKHGPTKATLLKKQALEEAVKGLAIGYQRRLLNEGADVMDMNFKIAKKERGWKDREFVLKRIVGEPLEGSEQHLHLHKHETSTDEIRAIISEFETKLRNEYARKNPA